MTLHHLASHWSLNIEWVYMSRVSHTVRMLCFLTRRNKRPLHFYVSYTLRVLQNNEDLFAKCSAVFTLYFISLHHTNKKNGRAVKLGSELLTKIYPFFQSVYCPSYMRKNYWKWNQGKLILKHTSQLEEFLNPRTLMKKHHPFASTSQLWQSRKAIIGGSTLTRLLRKMLFTVLKGSTCWKSRGIHLSQCMRWIGVATYWNFHLISLLLTLC